MQDKKHVPTEAGFGPGDEGEEVGQHQLADIVIRFMTGGRGDSEHPAAPPASPTPPIIGPLDSNLGAGVVDDYVRMKNDSPPQALTLL